MQSNGARFFEQTWLLAAREYRERVRSRAFLLVTLFTPLALGGVLGGSTMLAMRANGGQHVAITDNNAAEAAYAADELKQVSNGPKTVDVISPAGAGVLSTLNRRVEAKELSGYLWITQQQPGAGGQRAVYVSSSSADVQAGGMMKEALSRASTRMAMRARGLSTVETSALLKEVPVETEQLRDGRLTASDSERGFAGAYALVMLLYMVVLIYGMNVARSVVQEKTSRIYEVLLSTAAADSLIMGKLLGVGAAGLTQVGAWFLLLGAVLGTSAAEAYGLHGLASLGIRPEQVVFFLLFFVLGFLFYSGISAGVGAQLGAEQELQQFSFIIIAPLLVSVVMMNYVLSNPGAPLSVAMSFIPPFTPVIMYLRICASAPPIWQIVLSIVLLIASIAFVVWLAARIYRVGILMYGKHPTLPEALRWLRAS